MCIRDSCYHLEAIKHVPEAAIQPRVPWKQRNTTQPTKPLSWWHSGNFAPTRTGCICAFRLPPAGQCDRQLIPTVNFCNMQPYEYVHLSYAILWPLTERNRETLSKADQVASTCTTLHPTVIGRDHRMYRTVAGRFWSRLPIDPEIVIRCHPAVGDTVPNILSKRWNILSKTTPYYNFLDRQWHLLLFK